jgi:hypothetical protein
VKFVSGRTPFFVMSETFRLTSVQWLSLSTGGVVV